MREPRAEWETRPESLLDPRAQGGCCGWKKMEENSSTIPFTDLISGLGLSTCQQPPTRWEVQPSDFFLKTLESKSSSLAYINFSKKPLKSLCQQLLVFLENVSFVLLPGTVLL